MGFVRPPDGSDLWEAQIILKSILFAWKGKCHSVAPGLWFLVHEGLPYLAVTEISFPFQGRSSYPKYQIVPGQAALKFTFSLLRCCCIDPALDTFRSSFYKICLFL